MKKKHLYLYIYHSILTIHVQEYPYYNLIIVVYKKKKASNLHICVLHIFVDWKLFFL